jgi:hypothetical protein
MLSNQNARASQVLETYLNKVHKVYNLYKWITVIQEHWPSSGNQIQITKLIHDWVLNHKVLVHREKQLETKTCACFTVCTIKDCHHMLKCGTYSKQETWCSCAIARSQQMDDKHLFPAKYQKLMGPSRQAQYLQIFGDCRI